MTSFHQNTRVFLTQGFQSALLPLPLPPRDFSVALLAPGHLLPTATAAPPAPPLISSLFPQPFPSNSSFPPALPAPVMLLLPHPIQQFSVFPSSAARFGGDLSIHPLPRGSSPNLLPHQPHGLPTISPQIFQLLRHQCPTVFNHLRPSSKPSWALYLAESSRTFQALTSGREEGTWGRAQAGECQLQLTHLRQDCLCSAEQQGFCQNCSLKANLFVKHVP